MLLLKVPWSSIEHALKKICCQSIQIYIYIYIYTYIPHRKCFCDTPYLFKNQIIGQNMYKIINAGTQRLFIHIYIFVYFGSKFTLMHVLLKTRELLTEAIFLLIFSIFLICCFFSAGRWKISRPIFIF